MREKLMFIILYPTLCSCYFNPATKFIWSFIVPVILIFLANVGFFVMAIVIMCRHQKRQRAEKKTHKIK